MSLLLLFVLVFVELAVEVVVFVFTLVFEFVLLVPPEETLLFVFTFVAVLVFVFTLVFEFVFVFTLVFEFVLVAVDVAVLVVVVAKEFASQNSVPAVQVPLCWAAAFGKKKVIKQPIPISTINRIFLIGDSRQIKDINSLLRRFSFSQTS